MKIFYDTFFQMEDIKSVTHYKRDARAVFLYVFENSDDFHIFFATEGHKLRFVEQNIFFLVIMC